MLETHSFTSTIEIKQKCKEDGEMNELKRMQNHNSQNRTESNGSVGWTRSRLGVRSI